jgi:hypothetical protein
VAELTFRDFAGAVMQGDSARAATVLTELLALSPVANRLQVSATAHFKGRMADPAFMPKAMGLRTAVQSGSDDEIRALLGDCFALDGDASASAVAALRTRYPRPA